MRGENPSSQELCLSTMDAPLHHSLPSKERSGTAAVLLRSCGGHRFGREGLHQTICRSTPDNALERVTLLDPNRLSSLHVCRVAVRQSLVLPLLHTEALG